MNPLDAQRYDLSKRGLVSVTVFFLPYVRVLIISKSPLMKRTPLTLKALSMESTQSSMMLLQLKHAPHFSLRH